MNSRKIVVTLLALACGAGLTGCLQAPGKPGPSSVAQRPEETVDFPTLYTQNCAACHGEHGRHGAAMSLANPVYGPIAGTDRIVQIITDGIPQTMMPAFARSKGGSLTHQQISVLAQGVATTWGNEAALDGQTPPPYLATLAGDPLQGQKSFVTFCASCHGATGEGIASSNIHTGSLVDASYLALISAQGLRSIILAGRPDEGMPDWRNDLRGSDARPMTNHEVTDTVAWLVSHRSATLKQQKP